LTEKKEKWYNQKERWCCYVKYKTNNRRTDSRVTEETKRAEGILILEKILEN